MKKLIMCLVIGVLGVSAAVALPSQEVERAIFNQVSAQAKKSTPMPKLSPEKMKDLNEKLPVAKQVMQAEKFFKFNAATLVMEEDKNYKLDPAELGYALAFSVAREMRLSKEERTHEDQAVLSNEEQRAVYYALNTLLPEDYLKNVPSFKEYNEAYPVTDWAAFRTAVQEAQELVYQGVVAVATKQQNYRDTWLFELTH